MFLFSVSGKKFLKCLILSALLTSLILNNGVKAEDNPLASGLQQKPDHFADESLKKLALNNSGSINLAVKHQKASSGKLDNIPPELGFRNNYMLLSSDEYKTTGSNSENVSYEKENISKFIDVNDQQWAFDAVKELSEKYEILQGMPDGTFQGDRALSRYELAQALVKTMKKLEQNHVQVSYTEQLALDTMRKDFNKEIMTLAAKVEINEKRIKETKEKFETDIPVITAEIEKLKERHYFVPELRFRYAFGDYENNYGTHASARLRLNSVSKLNKDTLGVIRLQATTNNLINFSEVNGDVVDVDMTLGYIQTGALTRWIPEKLGQVNFYGGIMPTYWIFWLRDYSTGVDQGAFTLANPSLGTFNQQASSFTRIAPDGRQISIAGDYIKKFDKLDAKIQASVARSTGGSLNIAGVDVASSGDESTFYAVSGEMDLPIKKLPTNIKISHFQSFGDHATNHRTYSVGGRLSTKVNNVGVFKFAVMGHDGSVPPRVLGGIGGHGFSYQFAYAPTIRKLAYLFGDPDRIHHKMPNYVAKRTELGFGFANMHNKQDESIRIFDVYLSRYFTENIYGRIMFTHMNPNVRTRGLSARTSLLLETIFKI